jgi:hypothetical protein
MALGPPHNTVCNGLTSPPATTFAVPNQVLELPIGGDACFALSVTTSTPDVLSIEKLTTRPGFPAIISVRVRALAPGNGTLDIKTGLVSSDKLFSVSVFVDDCSATSHTIAVQPVFNTSPHSVVILTANYHGFFNVGMFWRVGGVLIGTGPSVLYTPTTPGAFDVAVIGESDCGSVEAHTTLNVSAGRIRAARH